MSKEDWNLENFAKFWEDIDYEIAMQHKRALYYYGNYGPPCDCGSSTCDECNPGWDEEEPEEPDWGDYF